MKFRYVKVSNSIKISILGRRFATQWVASCCVVKEVTVVMEDPRAQERELFSTLAAWDL